jgi:amino acid transporter
MVRASDRGQAVVVVLVIATVLFVVMSSALVGVGGHMIDRARAQTAADAGALAGIVGGLEAAETVVQRHDSELVSFTRGPIAGHVTVIVRSGTATARAVATDRP